MPVTVTCQEVRASFGPLLPSSPCNVNEKIVRTSAGAWVLQDARYKVECIRYMQPASQESPLSRVRYLSALQFASPLDKADALRMDELLTVLTALA